MLNSSPRYKLLSICWLEKMFLECSHSFSREHLKRLYFLVPQYSQQWCWCSLNFNKKVHVDLTIFFSIECSSYFSLINCPTEYWCSVLWPGFVLLATILRDVDYLLPFLVQLIFGSVQTTDRKWRISGHSGFLISTDFYGSNTDILITFWFVLRI